MCYPGRACQEHQAGTGASWDYKRGAKCSGMPGKSSEDGIVPDVQAAKPGRPYGELRGSGKSVREEPIERRWIVSKDLGRISSFCEKPITQHPRRLSHWLNIGQERKFHSLVDKVYSKRNIELAWEAVRKNGGAGGTDKVTIDTFSENLEAHLEPMPVN